MHRVIRSSTKPAAIALSPSSRNVVLPLLSRSAFSTSRSQTSHKAAQQPPRLPLQRHQKNNKSTLCVNSRLSQQQQQQPPAMAMPLTRDQMTSLFWSAAIPMVGFGFMDNFIMITAGSAIDNTLGVQMGLATMTAAAIGQVVSDVSGVIFGDTLSKVFKVSPSNLSEAQTKLKLVSRIKLGGAVLGVIAGCTMGAVALWLIPDSNSNRDDLASTTTAGTTQTRQQQSRLSFSSEQRTTEQLQRLQNVMTDIMTSEDEPWHDRRASCTLYVKESMEHCIPPPSAVAAASSTQKQSPSSFFDFSIHTNTIDTTTTPSATVEAMGGGATTTTQDPKVLHTLKERRVVVFANTIYVPIMGDDSNNNNNTDNHKSNNNLLGIFKIKLENGSFYNGSEIKDAKKVARNLGFFLNHMV